MPRWSERYQQSNQDRDRPFWSRGRDEDERDRDDRNWIERGRDEIKSWFGRDRDDEDRERWSGRDEDDRRGWRDEDRYSMRDRDDDMRRWRDEDRHSMRDRDQWREHDQDRRGYGGYGGEGRWRGDMDRGEYSRRLQQDDYERRYSRDRDMYGRDRDMYGRDRDMYGRGYGGGYGPSEPQRYGSYEQRGRDWSSGTQRDDQRYGREDRRMDRDEYGRYFSDEGRGGRRRY